MIKLDIEAINKVLPACNKNRDAQYYLKGINIRDIDGFRYYTATDGHILFSVQTEIDEDPLDKEYTLEINNPIKDKCLTCDMIVVDDDTVVLKGLTKTAVDIIDCAYPDWQRVVPSNSTPLAKEYTMFNPEFIKKLNVFIKDAMVMRPMQEDSRSVAKWEIEENGRIYTAVVMPIKVKEGI